MKKIPLFCALALFGTSAFALDKAGYASLKDVKILNNEMIDAVWERRRQGIFSVCLSKGGYIRGRWREQGK